MAGLRELKNRLSSIQTVGQLSGAMRTVSAAKYSRVSSVRNQFGPYAAACTELMDTFGEELAQAIPCGNPEAPKCYVVLAANRGLCGGFNVEITSYATELLKQEKGPYRLITVGKKAESSLKEAGFRIDEAYSLPDVPGFDDCRGLLNSLKEAYVAGEISAVHMVYQKFINMLSREAVISQILPMGASKASGMGQALFVPDKPTVLKSAALSCVDSAIYAIILEAAAGAQAATLVAMRSAYDNAQESILALETEISRRRQSEITSSVIETSAEVLE